MLDDLPLFQIKLISPPEDYTYSIAIIISTHGTCCYIFSNISPTGPVAYVCYLIVHRGLSHVTFMIVSVCSLAR